MSNDPFIDASAVGGLGDVYVCDARSFGVFEDGHVKNARRIPVEVWEPKARSTEDALDDGNYWRSEFARLGIDGQRPVVVYDDGRLIEASRAWLILQHFGIEARIVNGGWPAIEALHDKIAGAPVPSSAGDLQGAGEVVKLISRSDLRDALETDVAIVDVRTRAEYDGEDLRQNDRGGHLPGARHVPHASLLRDGRIRSPEDLVQLMERAGVRADDSVVTLCDAGGRAALAAAAAVRAGFDDVRIYYPSFAAWSRDESCPVVT